MEITDVRAVPLSDSVPEEKRHRTDLGTKVKTDATLVLVETDTEHTGIGAALGHLPTIESIVEGSLASALVGENPTCTGRLWEKLYNGSRPSRRWSGATPSPGVTAGGTRSRRSRAWTPRSGSSPERRSASRSTGSWGRSGTTPGATPAADGRRSTGPPRSSGGYVGKGFDAVKVRAVGREEFSVENTLERVEAAREAIGDDVDLMVDVHGSFDVPTAIKLARRLEEYDVSWFEEPVSADDHPGLAEVRSASEIPIAAGESEFTRFDFRSLFDHGAIDVAQPDVARCGGITECRRIAAMASARNVKLAPYAWGNGVPFAASIHLAMSVPNYHVLEVGQAYMPLLTDLFEEDLGTREGRVHAPDRPGLGFTLREDFEERFDYVEGPEYEF
ncbi:enolase [Halobacteriales archaeon QS_5_70_15]|nr:MAG: enolase [Halobacteriales archaeon QS_5_70_15]